MIKRLFGKRPVAGAFATLFLLVAAIFLVITVIPIPRASSYPADAKSDSALLDGYRHVEVASVSDAMEKLTGQRTYLSHRIRQIFPEEFEGFADTVRLKKEDIHGPYALQGVLVERDQGVLSV